jgi:dTDP-4-dehydrorhamnose 3,5-epimerase
MQLISTPISDLFIIQPKVFADPRGYFFESYNRSAFKQHHIDVEFVQDNQSLSQKNVLRGLHFQNPPYAQGKLVRVITGSVLDVAVDIRKNSSTYGKHFSIVLDEKNKTMLWIPPGFAHGFLTLEDNTIFSYKCTNMYHKDSEDAIIWNDPDIGIDWGTTTPLLSEKDKEAKFFKDLKGLF